MLNLDPSYIHYAISCAVLLAVLALRFTFAPSILICSAHSPLSPAKELPHLGKGSHLKTTVPLTRGLRN
jgi:hypothetical protein